MELHIDTKMVTRVATDGMTKLAYSDIKKATRYAINRALLSMRKVAIGQIQRNLALATRKMTADNSKYVRLSKASPKQNISDMVGSVSFSTNNISMMEFIVGGKNIRSQKGIAVKNRRMLKAKIKPGRTTVIKRAFLQKGPRSSKVEVFVRRRAEGFKALRVNSIGSRVIEGGIVRHIHAEGARRFQDLFYSYLRSGQARYDGK